MFVINRLQNIMNNLNQSEIEKLRQKIYSTLDPIINSDYSLIDIPDYNNIGDNLIWEGELDYLSRLEYKKLYETNCWLFRDVNLPLNGMLLLQGGGNFGDLYRESQDLKIHIIEKYIDRKILIFPQSIHYNDMNIFTKDLIILKKHPNLHICVRDQESYNLLNSNGLTNIYLLPDMAFCIKMAKFKVKDNSSSKTLLMKRRDKELNSDNKIDKLLKENSNIDILDWPTFNISKNRHRLEYRKERYNRLISKSWIDKPILKKFIDYRYGLKNRNQKELYINKGIQFLNEYETIYTTRLHGLILGILLNKNIKIIDNKHQKLTRYYNQWLKDFVNVDIY